MRAQQSMLAALPGTQPCARQSIGASVGIAVAATLIYLDVAAHPRVGHMAAHIFMMNALAPFLAVMLSRIGFAIWPAYGSALVAATAAQIMLLYIWHAPNLIAGRHTSSASALMALALLVCSVLFWAAILQANPWRSVAALVITGKLYCLLGVLLLFAPRVLGVSHGPPEAALADQRAAGLLMLAICPFSYVLMAVAISAREVMRF